MSDIELETAAPALEATLAAWEERLGALERQAAAVLRGARKLRKAAAEGAVGSVPGAIAALQDDAGKLRDAVAEAGEAPAVDVAEAFASGAFVAELAQAAASVGVKLVQRDGRLTAFPVILRLEARTQGVRIGRKLEKRIRPSFLARQLKDLQQRPNRFNARVFLDRLFKAYGYLAATDGKSKLSEGPLVPLADLHEALTMLPAAAADYPLEEFLLDLLRLDRQPDARTGRGLRFAFGGSTGTKGAKRLSAYDEAGVQHDYYAIRFLD